MFSKRFYKVNWDLISDVRKSESGIKSYSQMWLGHWPMFIPPLVFDQKLKHVNQRLLLITWSLKEFFDFECSGSLVLRLSAVRPNLANGQKAILNFAPAPEYLLGFKTSSSFCCFETSWGAQLTRVGLMWLDVAALTGASNLPTSVSTLSQLIPSQRPFKIYQKFIRFGKGST